MKAPESKAAALKASELKSGEFDRAFDAGEDVSGHVDWAQARRVNLEPRRINIDFPTGTSRPGSLTRSTGRPGCRPGPRGSRSSSCGSPNG